jgi:DNA topoisomerase-1
MSRASADIEFGSEELARIANLRYVLDDEPGFKRLLNGKGFVYRNAHGRRLRDKRQLARIDALAIPPAWTDVWISRFADGHLQATGHDARGRKQYLYHEHWREISNAAKFWRLKACPRILPKLRQQVTRDLRGRDLTAARVLAGMVAMLDLTSIRIGNEEYVRENKSYGLATLRNRHVRIAGPQALLQFRAKSGLRREAVVTDRRLVRLLKELKKVPGAHVFQYRDETGAIRPADAPAVNAYLQERTGQVFTAKDFRTWKGSALAAGILYDDRAAETLALRKRIVNRAIAAVAEALGNTSMVCRKYYIHPGLIDAYLNGELQQVFARFRASQKRELARDEQILAGYLRSNLA